MNATFQSEFIIILQMKLGQIVLKGVNWVYNDEIRLNGLEVNLVHNTKIRSMVLKGFNWVHNAKIRLYGHSFHQKLQILEENPWFLMKTADFGRKSMVFGQQICGFHQNPWFSTKSMDFQLQNLPKSADFILQDHEV